MIAKRAVAVVLEWSGVGDYLPRYARVILTTRRMH